MKRVLVTPLDWGLGHATRCIRVIRELQEQSCVVIIAGSGDSLALLRHEFPTTRFYILPAYAPRYALNGSMALRMALQLPRFIRVISSEHRAVEEIVAKEQIDFLISDNRYGCWSKRIPSVFITHQSNILMPKRFGWLKSFVRRINERMMNRFTACWIPDDPSTYSLAGDLISFGKARVKVPVHYVGWLSRFEKGGTEKDVQYDVIAVLSGPEPQRTALEEIVVPQLRRSALRFRVVRGLPAAPDSQDEKIVNFLPSGQLQAALESSALVIARSGYSTVMDLTALGKKAVFIPTPGQTEQEYLANRLTGKGIAYSMSQKEFDLDTAINESKKFRGFIPYVKNRLLVEAIRQLINDNLDATVTK
jgi:uncharacterized protein (TIGR00661 family)